MYKDRETDNLGYDQDQIFFLSQNEKFEAKHYLLCLTDGQYGVSGHPAKMVMILVYENIENLYIIRERKHFSYKKHVKNCGQILQTYWTATGKGGYSAGASGIPPPLLFEFFKVLFLKILTA